MGFTVPRWYQRSLTTILDYKFLKKQLRNIDNIKLVSMDEKYRIFNIVKDFYVHYWSTCRDLLKQDGVINYYPIEILKIAETRGYANNVDLWIDFTRYRRLLDIPMSDEQRMLLLDEILEKYIPAIDDAYQSILIRYEEFSKLHDVCIEPNEKIENYPDIRPEYSPSVMHVSLKVYQQLLQFFISHKEIKRVWLYGSRVDNGREGADIDLLMDIPKEDEKRIVREINNLRILNRIDIHTWRTVRVDKKEKRNYKIIYRSIDFNNNNNKENETLILPRWHQRSFSFFNAYKELENALKGAEEFSLNSHNKNTEIYQFFIVVFVLYWKILRDILKEQGEKKYYPTEIFKFAQERDLINDGDIWIEFNNYRRVLAKQNNRDFIIKTLYKFIPAIKKSKEKIEEKFNEYSRLHNIKYNTVDKEANYPNERPEYSPEIMNISLKSYSLLLQFFITHKDIKRVWFFGSMSTNPREGADIDLLMDIPKSSEATIKEQLNKLRILNRIDIHCYKTLPRDVKERPPYKIVYRAIDFE